MDGPELHAIDPEREQPDRVPEDGTSTSGAVRINMKSLSTLVSTAMDDAKAKIASATDAARPKLASVEPTIAPAIKVANKGEDCPPEGKDKKTATGAEKRASAVTIAQEALKFAENLEQLAVIFPKIASGPGATETFVSPDKGVTKDTNTKATSLPAEMAGSGGDSGKGRDVETNKNQAPYAKKAAEEMLNAKIAQSEALRLAGRAKEAEALAKQAADEFKMAKKAYDEQDSTTSTPKGNPKTLETFVSGTTGAPGGVAPDNAGAASFTKRDGKKREIAPLSQHIKEPAFSAAADKGLSDNLDHTEGAKIAASIIASAKARKTAATTAS